MSFFSNRFVLPSLKKLQPDNLIALTDNNNQNKLSSPVLPSGITLSNNSNYRDFTAIIEDITNHRLDKISLLEWVYFLGKKSAWDNLDYQLSIKISSSIWDYAKTFTSLKLHLFWLLISAHFNPDKVIIHSAVINGFSDFLANEKKDNLNSQIVNLMLNDNYENLAISCCKLLLSPQQSLTNYSLPYQYQCENDLSLLDNITIFFPVALSKFRKVTQEHISLLLTLLNNLSFQSQLYTVENLFASFSSEIPENHSSLMQWLKKHYSPTINNSRWDDLSSQSKAILKQWLGALNYQDFANLITVITEKLVLKDWEKNQLIKRKIFWSNYSEKIERIKILMPSVSANLISSEIITQEEVSVLLDDGSEDTEICVFDFGKWLIVEFFRGGGSEMRIFEKSRNLTDLFFDSALLSTKKFRSLPINNNNIHDHKQYWQNFAERLLASKGIYPNNGVNYFKIDEGKKHFSYNQEKGILSTLSAEKLEKREQQLFHWKRDIKRLEREGKSF